MSTWWSPVSRSDLGLSAQALGGRCFSITNRQWYFLYRVLKFGQAQRHAVLAEEQAFIPTALALHWAACINGTAAGKWMLKGKFNGSSVVADGIVHETEAQQWVYTHELTPFDQTPAYQWLLTLGQGLALSTNGFFMTGKPKKGSTVSVSLLKGQKVDIAKLAEDAGAAPGGLTKLRIGLGWDARQGSGEEFDLDASLVGCTDAGVAFASDWFVYFNNKSAPNGAITHSGDELTGAAAGDDESILVDLAALPAEVTDLRVFVSIFKAKERNVQTFTQVNNAFIRVIDEATGTELCRFDLTEDTAPTTNCIEFGRIYLHNGAWQFKANPVETDTEIDGILSTYKI